jgi:hypothetical protein
VTVVSVSQDLRDDTLLPAPGDEGGICRAGLDGGSKILYTAREADIGFGVGECERSIGFSGEDPGDEGGDVRASSLAAFRPNSKFEGSCGSQSEKEGSDL